MIGRRLPIKWQGYIVIQNSRVYRVGIMDEDGNVRINADDTAECSSYTMRMSR